MAKAYDLNKIEELGHDASIAASATSNVFATFNLDRVRTAVITVRGTYGASSSGAATVKLYYSADQFNWDTVPYTSFQVDLTAGATVQESKILDVPEVGDMKVEVVNGAGDTFTNVKVFVTKRRWRGVTN